MPNRLWLTITFVSKILEFPLRLLIRIQKCGTFITLTLIMRNDFWLFIFSCCIFSIIVFIVCLIRRCYTVLRTIEESTSSQTNQRQSHISATFPIEDHMILQGNTVSSPSEEYDSSRDLPPSYEELFGDNDGKLSSK